jgi:hypothetical protein
VEIPSDHDGVVCVDQGSDLLELVGDHGRLVDHGLNHFKALIVFYRQVRGIDHAELAMRRALHGRVRLNPGRDDRPDYWHPGRAFS